MIPNILTGWNNNHNALYGKHTINVAHRLHENPLFSEQAIVDLIDKYPEEKYGLNTMGTDHCRKQWREGTVAGHSGREVLNAISKGRMWINLREVMEVDPRYDEVLTEMFGELETLVPGLRTFKQKMGILVSSPGAQVYYHADIPGQSLWQIAGRKRVYVYPNSAPFLQPENLEAVVMGTQEEEVPYQSWFDEHAEVYDLEPGQMLHWALNGPHRVVNEDCLNISITTEHWTDEIRKSYAMNYANGLLRSKFGYIPRSRDTTGAAVYAKAALALGWKTLGLNRATDVVRMVDFQIDPAQPFGMRNRPAYAK